MWVELHTFEGDVSRTNNDHRIARCSATGDILIERPNDTYCVLASGPASWKLRGTFDEVLAKLNGEDK